MSTLAPRQRAAAEELAKRQVRSSMTQWSRLNGFEPAAHHRLLIEKLEAVARGELHRLLFVLPPGSAKSTYASVLFPPWYLASGSQGKMILSVSHSAEFATGFARRARNSVLKNHKALGYSLAEDSRAVDNWSTTNGCNYVAAGVGAGIAGRRADLGLIDDPIGKQEDADSQGFRDKLWDWYVTDFRTRLKPGAAVVLVQTRWHQDDLAGRLLETEKNEWTVVHIPLIAEQNDVLGRVPGAVLWPEYFNDQLVLDAKKVPRVFISLYQGKPHDEEGSYFKKEWLVPYTIDQLPKDLRIYVGSDHALDSKEADNADRTCLLPVGVDADGVVWVLPDVWWKAGEHTGEMVDQMLAMMRRRKPIVWWAEREHISRSIRPFLSKLMRETNTYVYVEDSTPARDKQTRARSIQGRMSMHMVRFPTFTDWWPTAMQEMLAFPTGKHDDFVDALAHIGMGLDRLATPSIPKVKKIDDPWSAAWIKASDKRRRERANALALNG